MSNIKFLAAFAMLFALVSCHHRPLQDPSNLHYVRVYLDEQIQNVTYGFYNEKLPRPEYNRPTVMRVVLADPETDAIVSERFLQNRGSDSRGNYIDGYISAPGGNYNLLTYSFGSAVTQVRNEKSFYRMEAYTNVISDHYLQYIPSSRLDMDNSRIVNCPEHIFHDVAEPITIEPNVDVDTLRNANGDYFTAHSMVHSYYIQVRVRGFEWIRTAVSMLSGVAGSKIMHEHEYIEMAEPVQVFFTMNYTDKERTRDSSTSATLYTTFNTFGKLPDVPSIYTLNIEFVRSDGTSQVEQIDITHLFDTPAARDHRWLIIEDDIVISPPEGSGSGGMSPGVDVWTDVEADVQI